MKIIALNKRAAFEYFLLEKYEAGVVLTGSEVKSVRAASVSITEAFVFFKNGEAYINNMYVKTYENTSSSKQDERRERKLLLNKEEIVKLKSKAAEKGFTVVPTKLYLKDGLVKLEIALAKGKLLHDKRETIKKRDNEREAKREIKDKK